MVKELAGLVADVKDREIVICAPFTALAAVKEAAKGTNIQLGAQNMHWEAKGAFTGEISADMLKDAGCKYVIIGHSERRQYFAETDETVNKKVKAALASAFVPIMCVGETLEQRESGVMEKVIGTQVKAGLADLSAAEVSGLVVAYEPIWAIGTGKTASSDDANAVCAFIRKTIAEVFGNEAAEKVRIQYGGSVKANNAAELMAKSDIDGALVGGASLKAADFSGIVKF
ncbi:MAG: triose-phosphate isomerase, partial [Pelosinus sp.]|nr:triose-phosphate isomerase [Pelosinus sp.]